MARDAAAVLASAERKLAALAEAIRSADRDGAGAADRLTRLAGRWRASTPPRTRAFRQQRLL